MNKDCDEKRISIIVPVYKVEKYLAACVESIIGQSYSNLEIILIDDGSPDNCPAMCEEYAQKDARIKVIHKTNGGLSDARNSGLAVASGELLFFVDSDDYIHKNCLEWMVNEMEASGADIVECHSNKFIDGEDPSWEAECVLRSRRELTADAWLTETNLGNFISCAVWNKLYKAALYRDIRFPVGRIYEDEATTYKVINRAKKICRIDSKLYFYRMRAGSTITGNMTLKKVQDRVLAFQEKVDFFTLNGNVAAEKFSRAKLCLAAISVIKDAKELDPSGKTVRKLFLDINENYEKIKGMKSVPLKYRLYICFFLLKNKIGKTIA